MIFQINEIISAVHGFILPFTRIAALFSVAPIVSSPFIPLRIKVAIAAVITIFMLPYINQSQAVELFSSNGFIQVSVQILIGLLMGFVLRLVFSHFMWCTTKPFPAVIMPIMASPGIG